MMPVMLAGFCSLMTVIIVGRLVLEDDGDPVDVGAAITVVGVTLLALFRAVFEATAHQGTFVLALTGIVALGVGITTMSRHW